jgi:hypothetical protein
MQGSPLARLFAGDICSRRAARVLGGRTLPLVVPSGRVKRKSEDEEPTICMRRKGQATRDFPVRSACATRLRAKSKGNRYDFLPSKYILAEYELYSD